MPFDHRLARALMLGLFVGALSSETLAATFTWDGSVDREWGTTDFILDPVLRLDSNWDILPFPGEDDFAVFDGKSPGDVLVGDSLGTTKAVKGIRFDAAQSYRLIGGEIELGEEGIFVKRTAAHTFESDVIFTTVDTKLRVEPPGAELTLRGKVSGSSDTIDKFGMVFKEGDGRLRLEELDAGSVINEFTADSGLTMIDGGELAINKLVVGDPGSIQGDPVVTSLDVSGAPALTVGELVLADFSADNFIEFRGAGTTLDTELVGSELADYRLEVDNGAELSLIGGKVYADRDDEIVVRRSRLAVEAIDVTARPGSKAIRIEDPAGGGEALVIGGSPSDSQIDADIVDIEFGRGSLRKVGPARLTLNGRNTFSGSVIVESGELAIGRDGSFGDGAPIEVAEPATLVAHNDALRGIEGPGRVLALDDALLGDFTSSRGFHVGEIVVGPNDVVLLDLDQATLTGGTSTIADGRLRTTAGLLLEADAALEGYGVIEGSVNNLGRLEGSNLGRSDLGPQTLTLNASATGSGDFLGNIIFNDTFAPGDSAARVTVGSPEFRRRVLMEIGGLDQFDQIRVLGEALLGGELEVELLDGFQPAFGDRFELLQVTTAQGSLAGSFEDVLLPALDEGLAWQIEQTDFGLCVAVVPEPGSWVLLSLTAALVTRRPGRRHRATG